MCICCNGDLHVYLRCRDVAWGRGLRVTVCEDGLRRRLPKSVAGQVVVAGGRHSGIEEPRPCTLRTEGRWIFEYPFTSQAIAPRARLAIFGAEPTIIILGAIGRSDDCRS